MHKSKEKPTNSELSQHDRQWFMAHVEKHHVRLRAYIRCLGVRAEEVDDMAQEALLLAYEKRDGFTPDTDFGAWIRQIARRLVANERRKQYRRQRILSENYCDQLIASQDEAIHPALLQDEKDALGVLETCLSDLPDASRDLIHQRYFLDLSAGAIASRLGKNSNQIRQQLLRLRRGLLQCLEHKLHASGSHFPGDMTENSA